MKTKLLFKTVMLLASLFYSPAIFSQGPVSSGLIAHYCFDGNADDAVGTKHCTVFGASLNTDRNGIANSAYSFDGIDDYIQIPQDIWFVDDFTVSGWIYEESYKHMARFFEIGNGPINGNAVLYTPSAPSPYFDGLHVHRDACLPYTFESEYSGAFPFKSWVFVTVLQRGTRGEIWRNGVKVTTSSGPLSPACSVLRTQNYFGKSTWAGDGFFHGKMDDIRIYNRALSALEIDTLYKINQTCQQQTSIAQHSSSIDFYLSQNVPNPSGSGTFIEYKLPLGSAQASVQIVDITGKKVADYSLHNSEGKIEVNAEALHSGLYFYSLYADGKVLDKKKMMIQQ